jgi:5-methyltetrahydrofolate--homocysteine methyltransferase
MLTGPFITIGENIHASRIVKREGQHVTTSRSGRPALRVSMQGDAVRLLEIPDPVLTSADGVRGRIKHVQAAILAGRQGEGAVRESARAYLQSLALRQVTAGAAFLDLNVDEISPDDGERQAAMRWLVEVVEAVTDIPLAIDSSSPAVLAAGLAAARGAGGRPLLNSASLERPEVLELAVERSGPVVVSAAGPGGLPGSAAEQLANAMRMVELTARRGVRPGDIFIDPLVLPAAVRPDGVPGFLATVRELRRQLGPEVHITGGFSNVSYGLPARRVLNDVFLALAIEAGADSGIIDPLQTVPGRPGTPPGSHAWELATHLLLGHDRHGRAFVKAHRAGELGPGA